MSKEISKSEIRERDLILVEFEEKNGVTCMRKGVVGRIDSDGTVISDGGNFLSANGTWPDSMRDLQVTKITLLDRPTPPLPTTPGTIFRATGIGGVDCDVTVMVLDDNFGARVYAVSTRVNGGLLHGADHITAWEPIEVTA